MGIKCFVEFYGGDIQNTCIEVSSDEDFNKQAQLFANATEQYATPYLLGKRNDWDPIQTMVKRKTEKNVEELRKLRFPKNVREEWL